MDLDLFLDEAFAIKRSDDFNIKNLSHEEFKQHLNSPTFFPSPYFDLFQHARTSTLHRTAYEFRNPDKAAQFVDWLQFHFNSIHLKIVDYVPCLKGHYIPDHLFQRHNGIVLKVLDQKNMEHMIFLSYKHRVNLDKNVYWFNFIVVEHLLSYQERKGIDDFAPVLVYKGMTDWFSRLQPLLERLQQRLLNPVYLHFNDIQYEVDRRFRHSGAVLCKVSDTYPDLRIDT